MIVANRLPVRQVKSNGKSEWETSPGGLVSALGPLVQKARGSWVGWTGSTTNSNIEPPKPFTHDGVRNQPVPLSERDLDGYYYGFSNATLWPLYHDAIRTPVFRRKWWRRYVEVNERFADAAAKTLGGNDAVWIHDYHLQLVPSLLRESSPHAQIGFFLHIPFPPEEVFARLPWRKQIIEGLLGADLLGFQTRLGARNFSRCARRFTSARGNSDELRFHGRTIHIGAYPISIDVERYEKVAQLPEVIERAKRLRQKLGPDRTFVLGVDRADYSKGIDVRLRAFREVLQRGKVNVRNCVFTQIAVPTRSRVEEYETLRRTVEELVGRINGEFGEPALPAVHYLRRNLPMEELVAMYLAADVMAVTPLRDGMNLVAKEYVACRRDNTGSLVLSEFAGAAHELRTAIQVNPYDVDGVASALEQAITLDRKEARRRMSALRRALKRNTVFNWADRFLRHLRTSPNGRAR